MPAPVPEVRTAGDRALARVTGVVATIRGARPELALDLWALAHGYAALLTDGALGDHEVDAPTAGLLARHAALTLLRGMSDDSPS